MTPEGVQIGENEAEEPPVIQQTQNILVYVTEDWTRGLDPLSPRDSQWLCDLSLVKILKTLQLPILTLIFGEEELISFSHHHVKILKTLQLLILTLIFGEEELISFSHHHAFLTYFGNTYLFELIIHISNDIESNPGPVSYLDLSIQYAKNYLCAKDYDSQIIKDHVDRILTLQSTNYQIPDQYLTNENILLWAKIKSKANGDDAFDDDFCQKVHCIWSYWDNQAFNQEFPQINNHLPNTSKKVHQNTPKRQNYPVTFSDKTKKETGFFKYIERTENGFICLVAGCPRRKKPMKDRETLKNHVRRDHSLDINLKKGTEQKVEPLKCLLCEKTFSRHQTLKNHQDTLKCQFGVNQTPDVKNFKNIPATSQSNSNLFQAETNTDTSNKITDRSNVAAVLAPGAILIQNSNQLGFDLCIPTVNSTATASTGTAIQQDLSTVDWDMEAIIKEQDQFFGQQQNSGEAWVIQNTNEQNLLSIQDSSQPDPLIQPEDNHGISTISSGMAVAATGANLLDFYFKDYASNIS